MILVLIASMLLGQAPGPVAVESLPVNLMTLAGLEKAEVRVTEDGQAVTYSGVALATILERQVKGSSTMAGLRSLSDSVLLVRGSDGYQAAVSAASVAMDSKGERFLLATAREGRPLGDAPGPVRLIVPGDPRHARWVRNVVAVRLVRLDKVVAGP